MNKKHQRFGLEYIKDFNGSQAAIRAGYSPKTAGASASRLLTNVKIQEFIAKKMKEMNDKTETDVEYIRRNLLDIAELSVKDILNDNLTLRPLSEWPDAWAKFITAIDLQEIASAVNDQEATIHFIKKIKWPDKMKTLELLGKHVDVQAFKDRVDHLHKHTLEDLVAGAADEQT